MRINASRPRQTLKRIAQAGRLSVHASRDSIRFWRHSALSVFDAEYEQLVGRIMYNVHALEKGLAQGDTWRPGRGRKALRNLNDALAMYVQREFDEASYAYTQGLSILQRYIERHESSASELAFLSEIVDGRFLTQSTRQDNAVSGVKVVRREDKVGNAEKGFFALAQGRSSVRSFSGEAIPSERVMNALINAEKTPSVCNRQGWKVYWTEDKELAATVLKHQRGFAYKQMPEVLLTITVSNSVFISPVERNQGFIDGGLYAMSVLYGLEAEGLAAVPLNACLYARDRAAVQSLLAIDPAEEIIMFIAIGDHPAETIVPVSERRPTASFIRHR
ncbi:nitroreductase family protein [Microbacterium jiangjiandongii]|uniref:nitroreductase family protein n=1 Tax=Microbacterium jiangjiandongii TaxID=3049071 RepID=UPI00214B09ED|nr:nitroreductase family protein [Microbacterium sp. zg.Y843]MCR2815877.1 nitroreductase family protein [Microbacterium sp. zg.Y843]